MSNTKFILDLEDLWPEAFRMAFDIPILSELFFLPFQIIANAIYRRSDVICAVSQTYVDRALLVNKKCDHGYAFYLGTELETFDKNIKKEISYTKEPEELWLAYCGTLGTSYDIPCVIDALALLNNQNLKFVIMGDGPLRQDFEKYAQAKKVNALFTGNLPYDTMCSLLSRCDFTVNPLIKTASQSIINKHADYAASGLPVLNTQSCLEYEDLVESYNMGYNVAPSNSEDLAQKLQLLIDNKELRKLMGKNARRCAEEKFDRKVTFKKLIALFDE